METQNLRWFILGVLFYFVLDKIAVVSPIILDYFVDIKTIKEVYFFIGLELLVIGCLLIFAIEKLILKEEFHRTIFWILIFFAMILLALLYYLRYSNQLIAADDQLSRLTILKFLGTISYLGIGFKLIIFCYLVLKTYSRR